MGDATLYAMAEGTQRRLAAIVAADVAGYSRLMGADEEGTIAALRTNRQEVVDPKLAQYNGRIANTGGDSLLIEFPSAVDALRCALDVQREMAVRNEGVPEEQSFQFRIGINVGDVVSQGDDLLGDGVNVAARLEGLAEPGGICLSRTARDQVRDRMDIGLEDLGEVEVKNIARPVRVFRVLGEGEAASALTGQTRASLWRKYAAAAAIIVAFIAGGGSWWWQQQPDFEPADQQKFAYELPGKPSIAVLPFDNLSGDPNQDFIGDGLTENIIAVLATSPDLFVIARNSAFTYKGKATKVQEIAEQLGVRYVLEGSVQREGQKLRVTAQLVDAIDGRHIWAERYDRELNGIFKLQDDIAQKIFVAMQVNLTEGVQALITRNAVKDFETYRLVSQASNLFQNRNRENHLKAFQLATKALKREPGNYLTNLWMGYLHRQRMEVGLSKNREEDAATARRYAEIALTINDESSGAHALLATLDLFARQYDNAVKHADRAVEIGPTVSTSLGLAGWVRMWSGQPLTATPLLQRAMRLDPFHKKWIALLHAYSHVMTNRYTQARAAFEELLAAPGKSIWTRQAPLEGLAVLSVFEGDMETAKQYKQRWLALRPNVTVSEIAREVFFIKDRDYANQYLNALRELGLPDHPPSTKPAKPSIAVLPFANLSDDKKQEYFADGMTDDLITDLSKLSGLIVIARNSVFTYKGKNVKVQEVAKDLNVTHVLEGSVRRAGGEVRINAQLIDANTGAHLWAETFDRPYKDIFDLQDEVTGNIATALKIKLTAGEKRALAKPPTENVNAYDLYLKAEALRLTFHWNRYERAFYDYREALRLDPNFVAARLGLAEALILAWRNGWVDAVPDPRTALIAARKELAIIKQLAPRHPGASMLNAELAVLSSDLERAQKFAEDAIDQYPDNPRLYAKLAEVMVFLGLHNAATQAAERALLLSPRPERELLKMLAFVFDYVGESERAINLLRRARKVGADAYETAFTMARAHARLGDLGEAAKEVATIKSRWPGANLGFLRVLYQHSRDPELEERYFKPLASAGIPEWPVIFDKNKQLGARDLAELLKPPYSIAGARFEVVGIKDNLMCVRLSWRIMGRSYCRPVYRDEEYIRNHGLDNELISPSIYPPGYESFSIAQGDQK